MKNMEGEGQIRASLGERDTFPIPSTLVVEPFATVTPRWLVMGVSWKMRWDVPVI